jgi:hypothetical protein
MPRCFSAGGGTDEQKQKIGTNRVPIKLGVRLGKKIKEIFVEGCNLQFSAPLLPVINHWAIVIRPSGTKPIRITPLIPEYRLLVPGINHWAIVIRPFRSRPNIFHRRGRRVPQRRTTGIEDKQG